MVFLTLFISLLILSYLFISYHFQWLRGSFYRKEKILKDFYMPENNESPTKNWPEKREIKITGKHPIFYGILWIVVIFSSLYFYSWFRWLVVVRRVTEQQRSNPPFEPQLSLKSRSALAGSFPSILPLKVSVPLAVAVAKTVLRHYPSTH